MIELSVAGIALALVLWCLLWPSASLPLRSRLYLVTGVLLTGSLTAVFRPRPDERLALAEQLPAKAREDGFVSSSACRSCHPSEWSSWHQSYHRTMTQEVTRDTLLGDFNSKVLSARGRSYRFEMRGDEAWVEMVDPAYDLAAMRGSRLGATSYEDAPPLEVGVLHGARDLPASADPPRVMKRVLMSTGSHNQQTYWVSIGEGDRSLFQMPWSWVIDERRWIPREDAFLQPPSDNRTPVVWNATCIKCHSVGAKPGLNTETRTMNTIVAELGIACEACHGPGDEHIRVNQSPLKRYAQHFAGRADDTMVNPDKLSSKRSAMVCGQCHSYQKRLDSKGWWQHGDLYRPGDDLELTRSIARSEGRGVPSPNMFWADGTYKAGGREYNGLIASACYLRGEMTCTSCHSMHDSDPADQLRRDLPGDQACLDCHPDYRDKVAEHSHHKPGSEGASCLNCHMPYTAYALFKAIRSHRVDSPSAEGSARFNRPTACELCHVDRSLGWASAWLGEWYGQVQPALSEDQQNIATSLRMALEGDASKRVFAAWHMGWKPARAIGGENWMIPYLAQLLEDPYGAVRFVAHRSLRSHSGYQDIAYDFLAPESERAEAAAAIRARWATTSTGQPVANNALLIDHKGSLLRSEYDRLLNQRDTTEVTINE